ncbi:MAG: hypothetical protein C0483_19900 [Pirellula sp.]|nr:hypothetical protein [Pirellula sp.]
MGDHLTKLDAAIDENLTSLITNRGWVPSGFCENPSGYAVRRYTAGDVSIEVEYERGLIDFSVGSIRSRESLRSASFIRDLLDPPRSGRWNLGLGAAIFVDERWDDIVNLMSPDHWHATIRRIDDLYRASKGAG